MTTNALISVIVPIYKVEEYLDECVTSIVNQTYKNLEIILVDDGSPDNCPQMCDEWAKKDSRIRVIHKQNGGLSSARNAGLDVASGDYIGFVDSDDFIELEMYEQLYKAIIQEDNYAISSCCVNKYDGRTKTVFKKDWDIIRIHVLNSKLFAEQLLTEKGNFTVWSKLYRIDYFYRVRFREGKINEDSLFIFDLSKIVEKQDLTMVEIPYRGYNYRQRPESICSNVKRPLALDAIENYLMIFNYYTNTNNIRKANIIRKYLNLRYIRLTDQVLQNPNWKNSYYAIANDYLKTLSLQDIFSLSMRNLSRYILFRYLPNVYIFYQSYIKKI